MRQDHCGPSDVRTGDQVGLGAKPETVRSGSNAAVKGIAATATVMLNDDTHHIQIAADQTVLDALRAAGLKPPFSCQSGICGTCRAQLQDGEVEMRARFAIDDHDIAGGAILACQAVAKTPHLVVSYD